jgi:hypothetical protein
VDGPTRNGIVPTGSILFPAAPAASYLPDQDEMPRKRPPPSPSPGPTLVRTVGDLGKVVRATRRGAQTDQITAAGLAGVGVRFLGDIERGKPTVRLGLTLQVLERLGLELWVAPRGALPRKP